MRSGSERPSLNAHEPAFSAEQLAVPPVDYVTPGHIHCHQNCASANSGVPVVYSSSIERDSFREKDDPKGFVLVTIDCAPKKASCEFVQTPGGRFVELRADLRRAEEPTEVLLRCIAEEDVADAIVRLRYQALEAQAPQIDMQRVRRSLESTFAVASIERQQEQEERRHRPTVTRESDLKEALTAYITHHNHLSELKSELIAAALEAETEYEACRGLGSRSGD